MKWIPEIKWIISNKIKPFKSTSYTWSSEGFIQCRISFVLVSLLSLLLTVQSSCIIHEDRFGNTKNHRIGKEVIYCPKEGLVILKPFLTPSNGQSPQSIFQVLYILRELFSIPYQGLLWGSLNPLFLIISTMRNMSHLSFTRQSFKYWVTYHIFSKCLLAWAVPNNFIFPCKSHSPRHVIILDSLLWTLCSWSMSFCKPTPLIS